MCFLTFYSGILSGICADILFGILSAMYFDSLSDMGTAGPKPRGQSRHLKLVEELVNNSEKWQPNRDISTNLPQSLITLNNIVGKMSSYIPSVEPGYRAPPNLQAWPTMDRDLGTHGPREPEGPGLGVEGTKLGVNLI